MKNKNVAIKQAATIFVALLDVFFVCGFWAVPTAAYADGGTSGYVVIEVGADVADFAAKDLVTGREYYYDVYLNGTEITQSEDSEYSSGALCGDVPGYIPALDRGDMPDRTIIGTDDRVRITSTSNPYSAICYISIVWPDNSTETGTAWMYWDDVAITSGHNVYSSTHGGWASTITVYPCKNGTTNPFGTTLVNTMHAPSQWTSNANENYDYAVLELSTAIGNSTGWFGTYWQTSTLKGSGINIVGYPNAYQQQMWGMGGTVKRNTTYRVFYDIDVSDGQSGAPVYWYSSNNGYQVVAIHTKDATLLATNSGTRITEAISDYFALFRV